MSARVDHEPPYVSLKKHASEIAPPVAARPPKALLQEFRIVLQRGLHFGLFVILVPDPFPVRNQPPGDEIVIVGVESIPAEPLFVRELVDESVISQDFGPISHRSPGQARKPAVHVHTRRTIEVAPLQIECTQVAPDALRQVGAVSPSKPLIGTHSAESFVFQRGEHPGKQFRGPGDIVVGKHRDFGLNLGKHTNQLTALVGMSQGEDSDLGSPHGLQHQSGFQLIGLDRHQENLERLRGQDTADGIPQLLPSPLNRWNHHGDILRRQPRVVRDGNGP